MQTDGARIYLSRHCKTAWNLKGRLQGTVDLPLDKIGVEQARSNLPAVQKLGGNRIVCSTARRAYQTAQIYGESLGLPIHKTAQLRELDHGRWEGNDVSELLAHETSGYAQWLSNPETVAIPGGSETVYAAQCRASEAIRHAALTFPGESLLVIGHKHINALLVCALLNERLVRFAAQILEDTLPHLLPTDAVEALCSGRGQMPSTW